MSLKRQSLGKQGEALATAYLKGLGYRIVTTNYRCRLGEIDIIAEEAGTLVFIEVKSRSGKTYGEPYEAVTKTKMLQMSKAALEYLCRQDQFDRSARFDVVSVRFFDNNQPGIELIRNAFDLNYGK